MVGSGGVPLLWVRKEACCRSWPAAEGLTAADEDEAPAIAAALLADTGGLNAAPVRLLLRGLGNVIIVVGVVGVGFGLLSMLDTRSRGDVQPATVAEGAGEEDSSPTELTAAVKEKDEDEEAVELAAPKCCCCAVGEGKEEK
jgi:hypothetical protein